MQTTTALRLYGKRDLRLETFTLPAMQDDEILARVVTDSLCLSSWKEANQGADHKKVPDDVATRPIIIGHEFCGEILAVGKKWQHKFQPGQRYVIQANLQLPDRPDCPGYSFPWIGGEATHVVIPNEVMAQDCLLTWEGDTWFEGSLVEPLSCVIGAFNANYHLQEGSYNHVMGIRPQGRTLILGGTGPMGLLAIDYALHGPINPSLLVVTDTNKPKLSYARRHYPSEPQTLIHYLVRAAGRNGNLLLNIGPQPDGKLPATAVERLREMGEWLARYGESIYGTRGGDIPPHDWGVTTRKGDKLYVHVLDLQDDALYLPLAEKVGEARCLNNGERVKFDTLRGKGIVLNLEHVPEDTDRIIELTLR